MPSDELEEDVVEEGPYSAEEQRSGAADDLRDAGDDEPQSPKKGSIRGRARSLSNTIVDLFGARKKKGGTDSETDHEDSNNSAAAGASRRDAGLSTETL